MRPGNGGRHLLPPHRENPITAPMKLSELLPDSARRAAVQDITGVTADSRQVKPGFVFVALAGAKTDGARFVQQALQGGASAIVAERDVDVPQGTAFIKVPKAR